MKTSFVGLYRTAGRGALALALLLLGCGAAPAKSVQFRITYSASSFSGPFSGRVVVYLSQRSTQPRFGPNWFHPEPMYSAMFRNIRPNQAMVVDDRATAFPAVPSDLPAGEYNIQAVLDRNLGGRTIGGSPGNLYSDSVKLTLDPSHDPIVSIVCNRVVAEPAFHETERVKEVTVVSRLLSRFYGRPTAMHAAVALPKEWLSEPGRRFPVIYSIPGFGGRHYALSGKNDVAATYRAGEPFLFVVLDPDCPTGHSVFADSANNGPWGKALVTELIPSLEKRFRAIGKPGARFVTGHSSGGWSSLWLQVAYPNFFGGCWSTSPDPVDFRDFQRINLYAPGANMFTEPSGQPRPLARQGDRPIVWYRQFSDMERPIRGEQLGSFEAVFSPRGRDGEPMKLWNRDTGAIDPAVASAWRKYDIDYLLRTRWRDLGPKLKGKLHVYTGDMDTFYLDGAVRLLRDDLNRLGSDARVEIFPGDHSSVMTPALRERIDEEMAARFRENHGAFQANRGLRPPRH